jgi:hypothetical protein
VADDSKVIVLATSYPPSFKRVSSVAYLIKRKVSIKSFLIDKSLQFRSYQTIIYSFPYDLFIVNRQMSRKTKNEQTGQRERNVNRTGKTRRKFSLQMINKTENVEKTRLIISIKSRSRAISWKCD